MNGHVIQIYFFQMIKLANYLPNIRLELNFQFIFNHFRLALPFDLEYDKYLEFVIHVIRLRKLII